MLLILSSHTVAKNSLLKLEDYQQCLEYSELSLNEALQQLNSAPTSSPPAKEEWVSTIGKLLDGIEVCFTKDLELLSNVPHLSSMARLANNLIQVRKDQRQHCFPQETANTYYIILRRMSLPGM